jgi:hypothetical protein
MMRLTNSIATLALCGAMLTSCATDEEEASIDESTPVVCEGPKCDGATGGFKNAFNDMKNLDLSDLTVIGAGLATDQLNSGLEGIPYASIQISRTALYGAQEETLGQTLVHDLGGLRAGLTERFGEDAFATRIVELRREQAAANDMIWAESHFKVGPQLNHGWSVTHGDTVGSVGFDSNASIETVLISPFGDRNEALLDAPLGAIKETRGWIIPRSGQDVIRMTPGESLAMRANGALGMNLGVGVPFLIGTVSGVVTLHARLSFGARVAIKGQLDVQLVRGQGNDVWVDVGMDKQQLRHFSVALTSGFGVAGLPEVNLDLGVVKLDVDDIAEKALQKQLNKHLTPSLSATTSTTSGRLTVARFRFDASRLVEEDVEQALTQAMRGDIRLAQALSVNGTRGVAQELDLLKDARSESDYVGFNFLGMEFYRANNFDTGSIHIEQNGENQTLLFSELEKKSGFFFTDRAYEWRKLVSIKTKDGRLTDASINSRMTLREADSFLSRDQMLDHIDPLVGYITGFNPLWEDVNVMADDLADFVDHVCPKPASNASSFEEREFDDCLAAIPTNSEVLARKQSLADATAQVIDGGALKQGFDPSVTTSAEFAKKLMDFKVLLASTNDRPDVALFGPKGRMVTQIRFSDDALHHMMAIGKETEFRSNIENVLRLMAADRISDMTKKQDRVDDYVDSRVSRLDELALLYAQASFKWDDLDQISKVKFDGEGVGDQGHIVLIPDRAPSEMDLGSVAEHKGAILEKLVPELVDVAEKGIFRDLDEPTEFVIGYSLLWMTEPSQVELLSNYVFDDEEDFGLYDLDSYGRGTSPMIEAGQFNIDELIGSN